MLVLSRRVGETLTIGNNIQVTMLGIRGNRVQIGISAPTQIPVHRQEIYNRIKKSQATPQREKTRQEKAA